MARLLRAHFASIGHPDARLAPLTLDFAGGADTILWLRNGGGKSTILNLFYSVLRPDRREFLGATAEGRARHIEDYVKADDLAVVLTEWDIDPPGERGLFPTAFRTAPRRRLIAGQVLAWRDRQRSADVSRLRRRMFTVLPDADFRLEDMPVEGLHPSPCRTMEDLRVWMEELRARRPELQIHATEVLHDWERHLESRGLDTELFRYQIRMNAREGGADEVFRFRTVYEFMSFYLDMAMPPARSSDVSATLDSLREKLARRPGQTLERQFLRDLQQALEPLRDRLAQHREASAQRDAAEARLLGIVARLAALRGEALENERRAADQEQRAGQRRTTAENAFSAQSRWARGLERRAQELELADATRRMSALQAGERDADRAVAAGEAAIAREALSAMSAQHAALLETQQLALAEQAPLQAAADQAGAALRAALTREISGLSTQEQALSARRSEEEAGQAQAADRSRQISQGFGSVEKEIELIDAWLREREQRREGLRARGVLESREEGGAAVRRWQERSAGISIGIAANRRAQEEEQGRMEAARQAAQEAAVQAAELEVSVGLRGREVQQAREELGGLAASLRQARLAQEETDPESPELPDRLDRQAERLDRQRLRLSVEEASIARDRDGLGKGGRLPVAPDVERALELLRQARVDAWDGARWLLENRAAGAIGAEMEADPALYSGIIVRDTANLERARQALAGLEARYPVVIGLPQPEQAEQAEQAEHGSGSGAVAGERADRFVLQDPACWDSAAARARGERLEERGRALQVEAGELDGSVRHLRIAAADLRRWLRLWGGGRLEQAERQISQQRGALEWLQAQRREAETEAARAGAALQGLRGAAEALSGEQSAAEREIYALQVFVQQYESAVEERRRRREAMEAQRRELVAAAAIAEREREAHGAALMALEHRIREVQQERQALERERAGLPGADVDGDAGLADARIRWLRLHEQLRGLRSSDRTQWEIERVLESLKPAAQVWADRSRGREEEVAAIRPGGGPEVVAEAEQRRAALSALVEQCRSEIDRLQGRIDEIAQRQRDAADLPPDAVPPTPAAAREQAAHYRAEAELSRAREEQAASELRAAQQQRTEAEQASNLYKGLSARVTDLLGEGRGAAAPEVPEGDITADVVTAALDRWRRRAAEVEELWRNVAELVDRAKALADRERFREMRSMLRERLRVPQKELCEEAPELLADVMERLSVVDDALAGIERDRRMILERLEMLGKEGLDLLLEAEARSRMPEGAGAWAGATFLQVRARAPGTAADRQARLEPWLERTLAAGRVPIGRELVQELVRELAGELQIRILKPDAQLRREWLPVVDMQTFSRGQQLTVAILLYCTLARIRARRQAQGDIDAGVLLLDNPVGTCSNAGLLELQRSMARQMRVQLVYTTGVEDQEAISVFSNTVRLRNRHRAVGTQDQHVTREEPVEAARITAIL